MTRQLCGRFSPKRGPDLQKKPARFEYGKVPVLMGLAYVQRQDRNEEMRQIYRHRFLLACLLLWT